MPLCSNYSENKLAYLFCPLMLKGLCQHGLGTSLLGCSCCRAIAGPSRRHLCERNCGDATGARNRGDATGSLWPSFELRGELCLCERPQSAGRTVPREDIQA